MCERFHGYALSSGRLLPSFLAVDLQHRLSEIEKSILRLATYELLFAKRFNKLTIINEYISIIEVFGGNADFANGILDNISKEI